MLAWNRDDALQDKLMLKRFRRRITNPIHFVPTAEGFAAAVRAGLGWGVFPEQRATSLLNDGTMARISEAHLDVPLFWQCWKLESAIIKRVTDVICSAAADLLQRPR